MLVKISAENIELKISSDSPVSVEVEISQADTKLEPDSDVIDFQEAKTRLLESVQPAEPVQVAKGLDTPDNIVWTADVPISPLAFMLAGLEIAQQLDQHYQNKIDQTSDLDEIDDIKAESKASAELFSQAVCDVLCKVEPNALAPALKAYNGLRAGSVVNNNTFYVSPEGVAQTRLAQIASPHFF